MASFSDKITLTIDVLTGKSAGSPLKSLRDDISQTDGAWGKLKTGASGAFDAVKANAAGLALGAGTALAGFAVKAVGDFQEVALAAGKFSEATGVSTQDASKFIEVAEDLGVGADTLERSIGFMNRTLGQTPEKFAEAGVEIARTKDGAVDVTGTFANVAETLNGIEDPAKRAAVAQQLLGRSWQDAAELIAQGGDGIRTALAGVESAKVISPDQVKKARDFRDSMDALQGVIESVSLTVGDALVPALTDAADAVGPLIEGLGTLYDKAQDIANVPVAGSIVDQFVNPLGRLQTGVELVGDAWDKVFGDGGTTSTVADVNPEFLQNAERYKAEIAAMSDEELAASKALTKRTIEIFNEGAASGKTWAEALSQAQDEVSQSAARAVPATQQFSDVQQSVRDHAQAVNDALQAQAAKLTAQADAALDAAGQTIAVSEAQERFADAAKATIEAQKEHGKTSHEAGEAVDAERDAMINAADAAVSKAAADARAAGTTTTATGKIDTFNKSLLSNAQFATPAARDAITDYILEANQVPEEKATDIRAAVARGDFDTAQQLLDSASRTRTAAINADANTSQAEADLNYAARTRTVSINARYGGDQDALARAGVGAHRASGGPVKKGVPYLVGEEGPEPFVPDQNGTIIPTGQAFNNNGTPLAGIGGGPVYNINITAGVGTNGPELGRVVVGAIKDYERSNGTRWRQ